MPTNDPTNDNYNPPSNMSMDFEEYQFGELEVDELFWQTNRPTEANPWRKENQTQGMNLRKRTNHNFNLNTVVWQKT